MSITIRNILTKFGFVSDTGALQRVASGVEAVKARAAAATATVGNTATAVGTATTSLRGMLGAWLGLGAIQGAVGGLISANSEFGFLNARLVTITGSSEKAKAAMTWITDFAAKTPFAIQQVGNAWAILTERGLDASEGTMTALGDLAAGAGTPLATIESIVGGMGDALVGNAERLRTALGSGFTVKSTQKDLTFTNAKNEKHVIKITKDLQKNKQALLDYLVVQGKAPGKAGMMLNASETLGGQLANLKDKVWQVFVAMGQAGLTGVIKRIAQWLTNAGERIRALTEDEDKMRKVAWVARKAAAALAVGLSLLAGRAILDGLSKLMTAIRAVGTAGMWANIKLMLPVLAIAALIVGIQDLMVFTRGGDSLFGRMLGKAGIDPAPYRKAFKDIGETFKQLWEDLKKGWEDIKESMGDLDWADVLKTTVQGIAYAFVGIGYSIVYIVKLLKWFGTLMGESLGYIVVKFMEVWDDITAGGWNTVRGLAKMLLLPFQTLWAPVAVIFDRLWPYISDGAADAWNLIVEGASRAWEGLGILLDEWIVQPFWGAIDAIAGAWDKLWDGIYGGAEWLWDGMVGVFTGLKNWVLDLFVAVVNGIVAPIESGLNAIISMANEGLSALGLDTLDEVSFKRLKRDNGNDLAAPTRMSRQARSIDPDRASRAVASVMSINDRVSSLISGTRGKYGATTVNAPRTNNVSVSVTGSTTDPVALANQIARIVNEKLAEEVSSSYADFADVMP
ncbi:MAG: hypothetical protein WCS88_04125 [Patescibacteria group bacterium]|jgi:hypothetical protein